MKKIGIVPSKHDVKCKIAAAGKQLAQLSYGGGPLLSNIDVVTVYWGSAWATDPIMQQLEAFFNFLVTSSYITQLQEYSILGGPQIGKGTHSFSFQSNSDPGSTIDDSQIQSQLLAWIADGTLPQSTANTLYYFFFPSGTQVTTNDLGGGASCSQFCGYHNNIGSDNFGGPFYAVENYEDCSGCDFTGNLLQNFTLVASHEFAEAITDPVVGTGWVDQVTGNEIGDICAGQPKVISSLVAKAPAAPAYTSSGPRTDANGVITVVLMPSTPPPPPPPPPPPGQKWTVQQLWSNNAQSCI